VKAVIAVLTLVWATGYAAEPAPSPSSGEAPKPAAEKPLPQLDDYQNRPNPAAYDGLIDPKSLPQNRPNSSPFLPLLPPGQNKAEKDKEKDKDKDWLNEGIQQRMKAREEALKKQGLEEKQRQQNQSSLNASLPNQKTPYTIYKPLDLNRPSTPWGTVAPPGMYQPKTPFNQPTTMKKLDPATDREAFAGGPQTAPPGLANHPSNPASWALNNPLNGNAPQNPLDRPAMPSLLSTSSMGAATSFNDARFRNQVPIMGSLNLATSPNGAQPSGEKAKNYMPSQRPSFGPKTKSMSTIEDPWAILSR
jgi:hypothetical protein